MEGKSSVDPFAEMEVNGVFVPVPTVDVLPEVVLFLAAYSCWDFRNFAESGIGSRQLEYSTRM